MARGVLRRGENVALTREVPGLTGLVLGVRWNAGAETALADNLVTAALLCDASSRALSEQHFVFFNQLASPDLSVQQLTEALGDAKAKSALAARVEQEPDARARRRMREAIRELSDAKRDRHELRGTIERLEEEVADMKTRLAKLEGARSPDATQEPCSVRIARTPELTYMSWWSSWR